MKKLTILIVMAALCLFFQARSQNLSSKKGLQIGDKVPDIVLSHLINYPKDKINFNEFQGKLVILDFWATYCSSCIAAFPKNDSLQQQFKAQILILGVANESTLRINSFFKTAKGPDNKSFNFPTISADISLNNLFPHNYIPHYVWIGSDGYVKAITGADEITSHNIRQVLTISKLTLSQQKDDIDTDRPLFINEHIFADSLAHYALLYHNYYEGAGSARTYRKIGDKIRGIGICNSPIISIYETAVEQLFNKAGQRYFRNRRIVESSDSVILKRSLWNRNGTLPDKKDLYNYDLILPLADADLLYDKMLGDLNQNSGYYGRIEKRNINCLVLKRTSDIDRLKTRSTQTIRQGTENSILLQNAPFSTFLILLNDNEKINVPVFDETGYAGKVDINIENIVNTETLNNSLAKYGLSVETQKRQLDMFIVSDNSTHSSISQSSNTKP